LENKAHLDIYAQLAKDTILLTLLVECKKNNPEFIDWVFFAHPDTNHQKHFTGSLIGHELAKAVENKWETTAMLSPMISLDWIPTSDAWETRGNYLGSCPVNVV